MNSEGTPRWKVLYRIDFLPQLKQWDSSVLVSTFTAPKRGLTQTPQAF